MNKKSAPCLFLCILIFAGCGPSTAFDEAPKWAQQAVWYQIFPERFRNGDPSNDPQLADIKGAWPHDLTSPYHVSNWSGDWYALQDWENPEKDFYYHVQRRRYGGDLQGVLDKLDYLQELGITAIYFNPLFESPSLHKYDAATYHHIDDNFGPNPERDRAIVATETPDDPATWKWTSADSLFLRFVREAHQRHIRIILDGVFNHVGLNFWAFRDVRENQLQSKYASWFSVKKWDNPHTAENEFAYEGWAGVKELPELYEREDGFIEPIRQYIFSAVKRWMDPDGDGDPSDGIDGWRLDVADKVKMPFWRAFRKVVRALNPDAYLVGEVWWENWPHNKMFNARPWLQGDVFDAVMNYRWAAECMHFFVDEARKIPASQFMERLGDLREEYPQAANYALLNLFDSHDTDRLASQIINHDDDYDHRDTPRENPDYRVRKPSARERDLQKLMVLFQMTYVGAPMIYYGDEAGMWGADDPDCRKPMLWDDLDYRPEKSHPFGKPRPVDANHFDKDLFSFYKKLIRLRTQHPVLQEGDFHAVVAADDKDVFGFMRSLGDEHVLVLVNHSENAQIIEVGLKALMFKKTWRDVLRQQEFRQEGGVVRFSLPARSGSVLM